jgi:oligopeptide/dipeptide ABC transporter ATP-binding protein
MKELTRRLGVALIVITHNLGVVARYADRVNVMSAGKIIESGTAEEICHSPQHPYTQALLKSVPRMDLPRQAKLDPVEGQPPDLTRLDEGCAFRPRCGFATKKCAESFPDLETVKGPHIVACFERTKVAKKAKADAAKTKAARAKTTKARAKKVAMRKAS